LISYLTARPAKKPANKPDAIAAEILLHVPATQP